MKSEDYLHPSARRSDEKEVIIKGPQTPAIDIARQNRVDALNAAAFYMSTRRVDSHPAQITSLAKAFETYLQGT